MKSKEEQIAVYYRNARELIRQNNPKAARKYVLVILNHALETYQQANTIVSQAKTATFLDQWVEVARQLREKGITDYVLRCFGFPTKQEIALPKVSPQPKAARPKDAQPKAQQPKVQQPPSPQAEPPRTKSEPRSSGDEIDMSGLVEEGRQDQGWCAKVFEQNKSAVVEITVVGQDNAGSGTGFIISPKGYLLTNDHVVFDEESESYFSKVNISFAGGKKVYKAQVLFSDKKADVALCRFAVEGAPSFSAVKMIADYSTVKQGADCLVMGNAFGMGLAPFTGIIRFTKDEEGNLVYTAPSNPGDSGGPVFNRQGECIGINKSKTISVNHISADGYANATPMDTVANLLHKWCSNNRIEL